MKADYVHKDTLTATDYVELNKNNELLVSYNQALLKEIQELKKQVESKYEKVGTLTGELLYEENTKLINQQKEFMEYLENEYTKIQTDIENEIDNNIKYFKIERRQAITGILQKYKSIIGDDK